MIYVIGILCFVTTLYLISILLVIFGFVGIKHKSILEPLNETPQKISIIIPVRNEKLCILECLESLEKLDYKKDDFEVIIVNDHSTDNTLNIINDFILTTELDISLLSLSEKRTKKEALRLGIEKSIHPIIATTDADCVLPANWLNNISSQFKNKDGMLLGPIVFKEKSGFLSIFQTLDMMAMQGIEFGMLYFQKPILNNAANLSYSKKDFSDVNGIDDYKTPSGDDIFLLEKFKAEQHQISGLLRNDFVVETEPQPTLLDFIHQRLRWASKSKYYSDKTLIFFSILVLIQNISLIFIYLGLVFVEKYTIILAILLFCKWLIDFILLFLVASFFKRSNQLFYFIPVQFVYPIYILGIWIASMTMNFEWKGRKFNG